MSVLDIIGQVLIVMGAITFATAGLGVLRFPDVYTRASAVSTAAGLGIVMVVVGALLLQPGIVNVVKVIALIVLQLATAAIGSIVLARAAYLTGVPMANPIFDELAEHNSDDS
ncbi:MAG: cation:proton antiporter [Actinobacteria bacterium HGW-Actinobacteria-4]|nr:MAG: cation:proton antiporter [Actinobacteria bacterium HGW-Actinobacteria-4]